MFSWITGPRITNAIEDLQPDANYESTILDAPETPAHQFAVKAFKHALFGTPAADAANITSKRLQKKQSPDAVNIQLPDIAASKDDAPALSPSKQPGGILRTPVTTGKTRKSVSFGAHVVDNEGKRGNVGKNGIPNDCPGKFPSPWTPGTELKVDENSEQKPRNKLTAALLDAKKTVQPKSGQKQKAKDDSDITMDLGAPRSESGKYWKEQYESYAEQSEKEMKKLVAKQQLAKNYAKKKDGEVTELVTRLEQERKRYRRREQELEQQNKDYQERLRQAMAENFSASVEVTALKNRISTLEKSMAASSSEVFESKPSFQIFEDASKNPRSMQGGESEVSYMSQKARVSLMGKENSPPKPRHIRRQTMPEPSRPSYTATPQLGVGVDQVSTILAKSPRPSLGTPDLTAESAQAPLSSETASKPPLSARKTGSSNEKLPPKSPATALASSPLPQPSPDPWVMDMDVNESSLSMMDKMALPIASGPSFGGYYGGSRSRPARTGNSRRHAVSKPIPNVSRTDRAKVPRPTKQSLPAAVQPKVAPISGLETEKPAPLPENPKISQPNGHTSPTEYSNQEAKVDASKTSKTSTADPRFDLSKITSHHAEGSSQVKRDRVQLLPVDRKEEARRRLLERKQKKLLAN